MQPSHTKELEGLHALRRLQVFHVLNLLHPALSCKQDHKNLQTFMVGVSRSKTLRRGHSALFSGFPIWLSAHWLQPVCEEGKFKSLVKMIPPLIFQLGNRCIHNALNRGAALRRP